MNSPVTALHVNSAAPAACKGAPTGPAYSGQIFPQETRLKTHSSSQAPSKAPPAVKTFMGRSPAMQNQLSQLLLFHTCLCSFQIKSFKHRVFSGLSKRATAPSLRACWQASSLCFLVQMHSPRRGNAAPWGVRVAAHMLSPTGRHAMARRAQAGCTLSTYSLTQGIISAIFCRLEKKRGWFWWVFFNRKQIQG